MRKLKILLSLMFCMILTMLFPWSTIFVQSTVFNIAAGSSLTTINSTIASAAGTTGATQVNFAAGSYNITSSSTIPCPVTSMVIQGVVTPYAPPADLRASNYSYTSPYTSTLNGSITNGSGFYLASCTHPITIQYLNWNGGQPSAGGGGFLYSSSSGNSNLTVQYNYIHGMWANVSGSHNYDGGIWLDGPQAPTPVDSNILIAWNVFGDGVSDCNAVMDQIDYDGGEYGSAGGFCNGVGDHITTVNLQIRNNDFEHLEQGVKYFSGSVPPGGGSPQTQILLTASILDGNDIGQIHRIGVEGQQAVVVSTSVGSTFTATNNSYHDPVYPAYGNWAFSFPMCCSSYVSYNNDNEVNVIGNTLAQNNPTPSSVGGSGAYSAGAVEWWATNASASNNLMQGYFSTNGPSITGTGNVPNAGFTAIKWGQSVGNWAANYNQCQAATSIGSINCVGSEGEQSTYPPTQTGNTQTSGGTTAQVSTIPTITISGNTVTITNTGRTSGVGPQGNTSSYYTLDGTTPTTNSTFCGQSCTFSAANGTVINAIGLWGQRNQPRIWPTNYGWVPSSTVTAKVSGGSSGKTVNALTLTTTGGATSLVAGSTNQIIPICGYSDGSTDNCPGNTIGYNSSNTAIVSVSGTGLLTANTAGSSTIVGLIVGTSVTSPALSIAVTNTVAPTLISCYQGNVNGVNQLITNGPTVAQQAFCYYGSTVGTKECDGAGDVYLTKPNHWYSSAPTIGSVQDISTSFPGQVAGITNGTFNSRVTVTAGTGTSNSGASVQCSDWGWTVSNPSLVSIAITSAGGATTIQAPNTLQLYATGTYSNGTTAPLTGTVVTSNNQQASTTNWKPVCILTACNPGGTNAPASTVLTAGISSPSLSGASMQLSETTLATSTQTNALFVHLAPSCDACRYFTFDFETYPVGFGSTDNLEADYGNFDLTDMLDIMFGGQCNYSNGLWQIANQTSGWTSTAVSCTALTDGAFHHVILTGHVVGTTQNYDTISIDGTVHTIGMTLPVTALPTGYASTMFTQFQLDKGATTSAQTLTTYIDNVNFTGTASSVTWASSSPSVASISAGGLVTGILAGTSNFTATNGSVVSPNFPLNVTVAPPPVLGPNVSITHSKFTGKVSLQ